MGLADVSKRILLGRKLRTTRVGGTLLPKKAAFPVFASDALSSVAYAPDEIFLMLSLAGVSAYAYSWQVGIAVAVVLFAVVASYRQTVHAYPGGGGDYEVATVNLGRGAGTTVASALLVDYVLTVAVSVSAAVQTAGAAVEWVSGNEVAVGVAVVALLAAVNLRGIRESGPLFALPTYAFLLAIIGMTVWGLVRETWGTLPRAESAGFQILEADGYTEGTITTLAFVFLVARAFSSGCAALTGVEAISNGVPAFRKPKSRNAATTLFLLGAGAIAMMMSVIALANLMEVRYVDPFDLDRLVLPDGSPLPEDYDQNTLIAQIAAGVFDTLPPAFFFVIAATVLILLVAANTAFNGFPVLGSILARDGLAPRQLGARGDRLAYSNGILFLAFLAVVLIVAFEAEPTRLIQLYIVGVFVAFNLSQLGMIRHWTRRLRSETDPAARRRMQRSRLINGIGLAMTAVVLIVVLVTKFLEGAWITVLALGTFYLVMRSIRRHYDNVGDELLIADDDQLLPTRVHAIVLVSKVHKPTMRALAYAKASRPNLLEAVYVDTDSAATDRLLEEWDERGMDVPLKVLYSPYREIIRPITEYARSIRAAAPRGVVAVYIPEYVVGRRWEQLLHNQTALRLKGRLLFTPGVMVTSVPYQLRSSVLAEERTAREFTRTRPGDVRRGEGPGAHTGRGPKDVP
ncbi:MAG: APC family permease [Nocardioides sp.]|nr:APC family permease [Nocardioides sp.]